MEKRYEFLKKIPLIDIELSWFMSRNIDIMNKCRDCGKFFINNPPKFCTECGKNNIKEFRIVKLCHKCKSIISNNKFCGQCGSKGE